MNIDSIVYLERLRKLVKDLPGVEEATSYGTPAFFVKKKLFARMKEDGVSLVVHTANRNAVMKRQPDVFYITDHYLNYEPYVLVRMNKIDDAGLKAMLVASWKLRAPVKLLNAYEQQP